MYASVQLASGAAEPRITLPLTSVAFNPYGATVYVVRPASGEPGPDGKPTAPTVEQRFVRTGATRGDQVAIVEGIAEGDEVVTSGQLKLRNGDAVQIDNSVRPSNDPAPRPVDR
jgi:membrane fusion protein (multidrug efflux system)